MASSRVKSSILYILLALFSAGCSDKTPMPSSSNACQDRGCEIPPSAVIRPASNNLNLYDKMPLSQNPLDYISDLNSSREYTFMDTQHLKQKLFMIWDDGFRAGVHESLWVLDIIKREGYKENLQKYSSEEKAKFTADLYSSKVIDHLGIISRNSDIRAFPTKKPYFYDPKIAGEGYPFDNFQSSRIYTNTPVRITAVSNDGAFYYVATPLTDGWIDSRDVLIISKSEADFLRGADLLALVDDKTPLFDERGRFIEKMLVGSFVFDRDGSIYSAATDKITKVTIDKRQFIKLPLVFSQKAVASLAKELMDDPYGWGGHLDNRDCSMYLRDLFLPFGLYLPRNSHGQAKKGNTYIDLSNMNEAKRVEFIKSRAVPFVTFLYLKGHILLYLGTVDGEVVALHDAWGFAYEEQKIEKRFVIGRPIISTLHVGSAYENFMAKKSIVSRLQGIRVLE